MKSVIHPSYIAIAPELKRLAEEEYTPDKVFCDNRNKVVLVTVGGKQLVLKKYKPANLFTGLVYTLFRKTKARRAYDHALRLLDAGFDTPFPVAYFEKRRWGLFRDGYFISEYAELPSAADFFYGDRSDRAEHEFLAESLSKFTLKLHLEGIIPLDFNMSNILMKKEGKDYRFVLIDINRMKFGRVPRLREAMRSFFQLGTYPHDHLSLLVPYTSARGYDFEDALYYVIRYRRHQKRLRRIKGLFNPKYRGIR